MSSDEPPAVGGEPAAATPTGNEAPAVVPRRLHPAGIAVLGVGSLRELALPLGVAFAAAFFGGGGRPVLRAIVFAAIGALHRDGRGLRPLDHDVLVGRRRHDPPSHGPAV